MKNIVFLSLVSALLLTPLTAIAEECSLPSELLSVLKTFDNKINENNIRFECKLKKEVTKKENSTDDEIITIYKSTPLKSKFISGSTMTTFRLHYSDNSDNDPFNTFLLIRQNNIYEGETIAKHSYDFIFSATVRSTALVQSSYINKSFMKHDYLWLVAKSPNKPH